MTLVGVQKVPGVPLIRFDGSSVGEIFTLIKGFTHAGDVARLPRWSARAGAFLVIEHGHRRTLRPALGPRSLRAAADDSGHSPAQAYATGAGALSVAARRQFPGDVPGSGSRPSQQHPRRAVASPDHDHVLCRRGVGRRGSRPIVVRVPTSGSRGPPGPPLSRRSCSWPSRRFSERASSECRPCACSPPFASRSAWCEPPSTFATTATAKTSFRIRSSIGPTPSRPWRSGGLTPLGR